MVSKKKREELAKKFQELSRFAWWDSIEHDDMERAMILVDEIIEAGWVPIEDFVDDIDLDYNHVALPEVEDVMSRIIHGLPVENFGVQNVKLYDVASRYPVEIKMVFPDGSPIPSAWMTIPNFENYEICEDVKVRSKWTKRVLDVEYRGCASYVEMHDKAGFPHMISTMELAKIAEEIFG